MNIGKLFCAFVVLLFIASLGHGAGKADHKSIRVSIIQLISNPKQFHKKQIRIIGASTIRFEGNKICLGKDDFTFGISKNCIWLDIASYSDYIDFNQFRDHDPRFALVEGVFNMKENGRFSMFSGSIERINRYQFWGPNK